MNKRVFCCKLFFSSLFFLAIHFNLHAQGTALNFDGSNDYVSVPAQSTIVNSSYTVMAWVMPTHATKAMHIFSTRESGEYGFDMQVTGGNKIHADIGNGNMFFTTSADANYNYSVNRWIHIAYAVTTTGYKIYINGTPADSGTFSGTPLLLNSTHYITIGKNASENTYFNGSIDEVKIYSAALTQANIKADMLNTTPSVSGSLVAHFNFDQSGTTLTDQGSNGYNGTLSNFALSGSTSNWVESYAMVVPEPAAASDITTTGFTANWTAPATGTADSYILDVSSNINFSSAITGSPFTLTGTSKSITGLLSGTTYYYRVKADKTSVTGQGAYSARAVVTTSAAYDYLSSLYFYNGTLSPAFSSSQFTYSATVVDSVVYLSAVQSNPGSIIEMSVNGGSYSPVTSGPPFPTPTLNIGINTIDIKVTDGTSRIYTLTLNRVISTPRFVKQGGAGTKDGLSWANASDDLQLMINNSAGYDVVLVAAGTYVPNRPADNLSTIVDSGRNNAFVLKENVKVYGGCAGTEIYWYERDLTNPANKSILSGDFRGDDIITGSGGTLAISNNSEDALHVVISAGSAGEAVLDGFTISGGNASQSGLFLTVNNNSIPGTDGGGVYIDHSEPTLSNLIITGCSAELGGAVYVDIAAPKLTYSTITKNIGTGAISTFGLSMILDYVTISDNRSLNNAGGLSNLNSSPVISNSTFSGNWAANAGGGIYNLQSAPKLLNVSFIGNTSGDFGGGMDNSVTSSPRLTNVAFIGNKSRAGGGLSNYNNSSPILTNVTFAGNTATIRGGAIDNFTSCSPQIRNSIIWGNNSPSTKSINNTNGTSNPTVNYSIVEGGYAGNSNKNEDPLFINLSANNCRVRSESPAINAGSNTYFVVGQTPDLSNIFSDIKNNDRFSGSVADMGAYEQQSSKAALNFDGVNDKISFGGTVANIAGSYTIEAWVRPTHATKTMHIFSTKYPDENGFDIQLKNGNTIHGTIGNGNTILAANADAAYSYTAGKWMHIAYVVSPSGYTIYINGEVTSSGTFSGTPVLMDGDHYMQIGYNDADNTFFQGDIDEIKIYNTALTKSDIKTDMISTDISLTGNLMVHFPFNEGDEGGNNTGSTTLIDYSDWGNYGTLDGFALNGTSSNWVESYAMTIPDAGVPISLSSTSFEANWLPPAMGTIDNGYIVEVATDSLFTSSVSGSPFTSASTSKTITGLLPNTNYYYRASADKTSVTGQGAYSRIMTVSMQDYTPPGNALNFDGTNDYISVTPQSTTVAGSFTVEAWVRPTDATKTMHIFSTRESGDKSFNIQIKNGNTIHSDIGNGTSWITNIADVTHPYAVNRWMHIAYTVSPTEYKIYADGIEVASNTYSSASPLLLDATHYITIGKNQNENSYFQGDMDEIKVYDRVLIANEIKADMTSAIPVASGNLVAHYNFDQAVNSMSNALNDQSGNGYRGTLRNFTLSDTVSNWIESYAMVVPVTTAATDLSTTGFTANWIAPAKGTIDHYIIDVSKDSIFTSPIAGSPFAVSGLSKSISGLTADSTYYYRVSAHKASVSGKGAYSATIAVTTSAPLPVVLVNYSATAEGNHAKLKWTTASEHDNKEFIISRSENGKSFKEIGRVNGAGKSFSIMNYIFFDEAPYDGANYYKLEQADYNGKITDYGIRFLSFRDYSLNGKLYPNPTDNTATLEFNPGTYQLMEISNLKGGLLQRLAISPNESAIEVSLKGYPVGMYIIKLSGDKGTEVRKLIKK